jgi:hypothetical protein
MKLSELAEYVTKVYGKTDSDTVALTKDFLKHRHRIICDSGLWKDMIGVYTAPTNKRVVYLPEDVDKVISVVFDNQTMDVNDLIRESLINPENISVAETETSTSDGTEAVMAESGARIQDGKLQIQDQDTGLWYDAVVRSVDTGGVPTVSIEGAGVSGT